MIILLDLDGVIINFAKGVCDWFAIPYQPEKITHWNIFPELTNLKDEDFWKQLTDEYFWKNLEFYPEAKDFIKELSKHGKVVLCTSPAYGCAGFRQNWIQNNLPEFFYLGNYIITPNKENIASKDMLLIDDSDKNCQKFRKAGGFTILYPQPWNECRNYLENKNKNILNSFCKVN